MLLDLQMSDLDGLECVAIIRERERRSGGRLPIIAMNAHAAKADEERCLEAGMDGYLSMPIHPQALYAIVDRHLGRSTPDAAPSTFGPITK